MANQKRKDFSYDLWGDPADAHYDGNKAIFQMNPKYGTGRSVSLDSDIKVYPTLSESIFDFKIKRTAILFYKQDSIYLGKVRKGKFALKGKNNKGFLFNEGDIFCFSGNFYLNEKFHYNDKNTVLTIGIFGYHQEIIEAFKQHNWSIDILKNIFEDPALVEGVLLNKTHQLEQIFTDLYDAMFSDNRFVAYVKSIELFYSFINIINEEKYKNVKTYNEKQVEIVINIKKFLDENLDKYYSMPKLAEIFNISLSHMQSIFNAYYGCSPYKYHHNKRLEKAHNLILNSDIKITEISKLVGFSSYDKFFIAYKNMYGCNPSYHRM